MSNPHTPPASGASNAIAYGDVAMTLIILAVMVASYVAAASFPQNSAFFPKLLSLAGSIFCLVKLALDAWAALSARAHLLTAQPVPAAIPSNEDLPDDGDEESGNEAEYHRMFSQMDRKTSAVVLAWLVLFFGGVYLFGFIVTFPIFTIFYLRLSAKASWLTCVIYIAAVMLIMLAGFRYFLHLPLPSGIFPLISL